LRVFDAGVGEEEKKTKTTHPTSDGITDPRSVETNLPPANSPLTEIYVGQYIRSLIEETVRYKKSSYSELAHAMSLPELILKDAVEGQVGLRRGQWNKIGKLLGLPTTFQLRPGEHDGILRWELVYPPVPFRISREEHRVPLAAFREPRTLRE
jgi:hypothetical protein